MTELKTIKYRGGIAEFSVPSHWKEEYEPAGGAAFYEDSPDSGTLRLSVLGFQSNDTPAEQMAATLFREGQVSSTSSGLPLRRREKSVEEHGEMLHIVTWEVAVPVPPKSLRLAIFSYTLLDRQLLDPVFQAEIALLERSIRHALYSQVAGAAGNYQHASSESKET